MYRITPAQHRVLSAIQMLSEAQGYVPSYTQLAASLGVSKQAIGKHVEIMCDRGILRKTYGQRHSIEVLRQGGA